MAAGFISEWWPASNRNGGRLQIGKPGRHKSESAFTSELPQLAASFQNIFQALALAAVHESGNGSAPRRRELPVEEESTQRVVD
jgi:hypothetical protein